MKVKEEVAESKEEPAPAPAPEPPKAEAPKPAPAPAAKHGEVPAGKVLATPAVRGLATEMNIDLTKVTPTGKGGRITKNDLLKYAETMKSGTATKEPAAQVIPPPTPAVALQNDRTVQLVGIQRAMAKSMTDAVSIPSYNLQDDICIDKINIIRKAFTKAHPKTKLTYLPFFIKAFSQAMVKYPIFNAIFNPKTDSEGYITDYIEKADHNIAIAIDSPTGLVVPNLKSVQRKSIIQINEELQQLIERGRTSKLTHEDLTDGTFTLSNMGTMGGLIGSPIIFRPQVAIAAMYRIRTMGYFVTKPDGSSDLKTKQIMGVSMSCDHRIIDGATGAIFITVVRSEERR